MRKARRFGSMLLVSGLVLGAGVACTDDEDGDGSGVNEEVETVESSVREAGNEVEQQVDEGAEENGEG